MENDESPEVVVVVPEVVPEEPDNLALHVGRLHESHESLRRDFEECRGEVASLRSLNQTLLNELQQVEEVVEEILEEEAVQETAVVADPASPPEGKRAHWLVRGLRGH